MTWTTLYRFYDASSRLLYVGIAGNPGRRFAQHAKDKTWWADVARSTMEHHPTREAAAAAEVAAITTEHPMHNVVHNTQRDGPAAQHIEGNPMYRLDGVYEQRKDSDSLVGSYFHSGATPGWQGLVVAEPAPAVYLVELFGWLMGDSTNQTLVPLTRMVGEGWQFYDDEAWMKAAYDESVERRWAREREPQAPTRPSDLARAQLARNQAARRAT